LQKVVAGMVKGTKLKDIAAGLFVPQDYFSRQNPANIFSNHAPFEVDLGCGDGAFLLAMAKQFPEHNFLGVERLLGRVRKVARDIKKAGLTNAKVLRLESKYTVEWLLEKQSIDRLHLLCPDPWPKGRHHSRRLVQQEFLAALWDALKPGGEFLFKTDHEEYFEWVCREVAEFGKFTLLPWQDGEFFYPKTDFQLLWESQGKILQSLRCLKPA
jgi:tRNA (guanine-N7-)-methyltransferase